MKNWFQGMIKLSRFVSIIFTMHLQKISSFLMMVSIVMLSIFGLSYYSAQPAFALVAEQDMEAMPAVPIAVPSSSAVYQCPIDGFVTASFNDSEEITIESEFSQTLLLRNNSDYTLSGVKVGLGVYANPDQIVPDYWFVAEEEFQLSGGEATQVSVEVDASSLPAGKYSVRSFTMQGNETNLLGAILRGESGNPVVVVKTAPKTNIVDVQVTVNGEISTGQRVAVSQGENISVQVLTTNENSTPVINSSMLVTVSQGDVPLGAALRASTMDSVKLVPTGSRKTQLVDQFTESGEYAVYAALLSSDTFQPVVYIPIQVGEGLAAESWAYLSKVGSTDATLHPDSEIIGCISYLGKDAGVSGVIETLGLAVEVTEGGNSVFTTEVRTEDARKAYLTVRPGISSSLPTISATLLQERFPSVQTVEAKTEAFLSPVQTVSFSLTCAGHACLDDHSAQVAPEAVQPTGSTGNSFYFYAAIVIAAALLMYIMLRRLHPEEDLSVGNNSNELQ